MEIENKKLKDVKVGDKIIGSDGKPVVVTHVFDSYIPDKMYSMKMTNGEVVECSANHLWYCETNEDRLEKKTYYKLAKYYFRHNKIPDYDMLMPAYPFDMIADKFTNDPKSKLLIEHAALSLGPVYQVPNVIFDGMKYIKEVKLYTYSFNDLIDFLKGLQRVVKHDKSQYFYFGKVRETDSIAEIIKKDGIINDVNIPEKGDIINGHH